MEQKILEVIDAIGATRSVKEKERILEENKNVELLAETIYAALSPRINYYISKVPKNLSVIRTAELKPLISFSDMLDKLKTLSSRQLTGHSAQQFLYCLYCDVSNESKILLERIIDRDLKFAIGDKIVNSVYPELLETTPYQGAKPFARKLVDELLLEGSVLAQLKMDGFYANTIIEDGTVTFISRQGERKTFGECKLVEELKKLPNCVLNGEFTFSGEPNRSKANGIISAIVDIFSNVSTRTPEETEAKIKKFNKERGISLEEAVDRIIYTVWDQLTIKEYYEKLSNTPYYERLAQLTIDLEGVDSNYISIVEMRELTTFKEIMDYYIEVLTAGLEGIIVKSKTAPWKDGKPKWCVKIKEEITLDLKITGYRYGSGKNTEVISSIEVVSDCGKLVTVPTSLKEKEMKFFTENAEEYIGKIIEVKCSGLTPPNKLGIASTLHPVFIKTRFDKDTANTYEECLEIVQALRE